MNSTRKGARTMLGRVPRVSALFAAAGLLLATAGCEDVLDIPDPENATGDQVAQNLDLLVNRAYSDFQVGYSGGGLDDKVLSVTGVFSDEFMSAGTFTTRTRSDQRLQFAISQGNTSDGAYGDLHDARVAAIQAANAIEEQESQNLLWAEMKALEGYTLIGLAENFCGAVPLSTSTPEAAGEPGQPRTTSELFNLAIQRFDEALGAAGGGSDVAYLAMVGKARAQLGLGNVSAAGATVSGVPRDFVYYIEHSSNSGVQENPMFNLQQNGRYSMANGEGDDSDVSEVADPGGNGIAYHHLDGDPANDAGDPRVPWVEDPAGGFDASIPLFLNLRYTSLDTDVVLADGIEAQLIRAEADIAAEEYGAAEDKLNDLREDVQALMSARYPDPTSNDYGFSDVNGAGETLPDLALPANQSDAIDVLFRERAFWLFNTGHRLGDMRRLARAPYSRSPSDVFPTGNYFKGGDYGPDVAFPVSFGETNNPNFSADMCDVTQP